MKQKSVLVLAVILSLLLSACASTASTTPTTADTTKAPLKILLVITGNRGDKSFVDSAQAGMDQAQKELNVITETVEMGTDPTKYESILKDAAASKDYDIMFAASYVQDYLAAIAPQYPDKKFVHLDAEVAYATCSNKCVNVYSVLYKQNEGSYLAGLYAALMVKGGLPNLPVESQKIGVIGGQDVPVINDFIIGYKQGAAAGGLDRDKDVLVQYAGSWSDPAKAKEISTALHQQGASIIFNVAGGSGMGIFEAAAETKNLWAIGVDVDQYTALKDQKPELANIILTSMQKNVGYSIYRTIKMAQNNQVPWGKTENLGIAEGGVALAINDKYKAVTPENIQQKIDQAITDVTAGKIKIETVF